MRTIQPILASIVFGFASAVAALAQSPAPAAVPRVINLTGVFQPVDGQPPRAVETVTLAIYAEPTGGTPLWQETQSVAVDAKGRYALLLGATSAEGLPAAVLAAGAQWLGTTFDRPGEVEGPRLQLTSVPYTLRAADADTLGGRPASAYLLAPTPPSGKGAKTTPAGHATATDRDPSAPAPQAVNPGTVNFLSKYVTAADVGNSAVFENLGRVGIGTTAPFDSLHVNFTNTNGAVTGYAVQNLGNTTTSYSGMLFYDQNGALGQFQGFNNLTHEYRINNIAAAGSINFMLTGTSRFLVAPNTGYIGIGTTTPSSVLEVSNALSFTGGTADVNATSYTPVPTAQGSSFLGRKARGTPAAPSSTQSGDALAFFGGKGYGTTAFGPSLQGTGGMTVQAMQTFTDASQPTALLFSTTPVGSTFPTTRMMLDGVGNLGVGTNAPNATIEASNATNSAAANASILTSTWGANSNASIFLGRKARGTPGAPTAVQNGDSLVGFLGQGYGSTAFSGTRGGMFVRAAENWTDAAQGTSLVFSTTTTGTTAPSAKMVIDHGGNVGLGTLGPTTALDMVRDSSAGRLEIALTRYAGTSTSGEPNIVLRTARGSLAAPSAVQKGDELGGLCSTGYGATDFGSCDTGLGGIAAENWTDTAQGSALIFGVTPLGASEGEVNMVILPGGNVGIGSFTEFPTITDKLQAFGDIRVGTSGTNGCLKNFAGTGIAGTCASDRRFKKNITPFGPALDRLTALQPVHYHWRATEFPERHFGDAQAYGLIAQDVEQVLPELVATNDDGFKAIDYSKLPLLTIQAVKELKSENDALKERVADLERIVTQMLSSTTRR